MAAKPLNETSIENNVHEQLGLLLNDACCCIPKINNIIKKLEGTKTVLCMKRDMARTEIRKAAQFYHDLVNQQVRKLEDRLSHLVTDKVNKLMRNQEELLAHMRSIASMCNEAERLLEAHHETELMAEGPRIMQEIKELIEKEVGDTSSDHSVLKFVPLREEQMEREAGALGYIQHQEVDIGNVQVNFLDAGQRASVGVESMMMIVVHADITTNLLDVIEVRMNDSAARPIPYMVNDMKDGTILVQYAPERPGLVKLEVLVYGSHIVGSPFTIEVTDIVEVDPVAKRICANGIDQQEEDSAKSRSRSDPGTSRRMSEDDDIAAAAERIASTTSEPAFATASRTAESELRMPGASVSCPQLPATSGKTFIRKPAASGDGSSDMSTSLGLTPNLFDPASLQLKQEMLEKYLGGNQMLPYAAGDSLLQAPHRIGDGIVDRVTGGLRSQTSALSSGQLPSNLLAGRSGEVGETMLQSITEGATVSRGLLGKEHQVEEQAAKVYNNNVGEKAAGSSLGGPAVKLPCPTKEKGKPDRSLFSVALQSTLQQPPDTISFYNMRIREDQDAEGSGDQSRSSNKSPPVDSRLPLATQQLTPTSSLDRQSVAPIPMVAIPTVPVEKTMVTSLAEVKEEDNYSPLGRWLQQNSGQAITAELTLKIGRFGATSEPLALNFPIGVSVTKDEHIVVCANGLDMVKIFDWKGQSKFVIGARQGKIKFNRPSAVAINEDNQIFIKDDKQIQVFDAQGQVVRRFGVGILQKPYGLAFTEEGNLLVLDHNRGSTIIFSQKGELVSETAYEPMAVMTPNSKFRFLAIHNNRLIAADLGASYIHITDVKSGKILTTIGQPGNRPGEFREPSGVTVDSQGHIIIADSKNDRIQVFYPDGQYAAQIKLSEPIVRPSDIHLHKDRYLLVDNLLQHNVKVYELKLD